MISRAMSGPELREIRLALDLTQAELADQLGVWPESVTRWETGARRISPLVENAVLRLAEQLLQEVPA